LPFYKEDSLGTEELSELSGYRLVWLLTPIHLNNPGVWKPFTKYIWAIVQA